MTLSLLAGLLLNLQSICLMGKKTVFAQYGSYWRTVRKICTLELLSSVKINSFQAMRKEELELLIEYKKQAAVAGAAVNLSAKVS